MKKEGAKRTNWHVNKGGEGKIGVRGEGGASEPLCPPLNTPLNYIPTCTASKLGTWSVMSQV